MTKAERIYDILRSLTTDYEELLMGHRLSLRSSLVFWMQVKISWKRALYSGRRLSSGTGVRSVAVELDRRRTLAEGLLDVWTSL